jgi:hypothetical protein
MVIGISLADRMQGQATSMPQAIKGIGVVAGCWRNPPSISGRGVSTPPIRCVRPEHSASAHRHNRVIN